MSQSKEKERGKSNYLDDFNPAARRHVVACISCGKRGSNPATLENETNPYIVQEISRMFEPLSLDDSGVCDVCLLARSNVSGT
jgi:hypothetical protein